MTECVQPGADHAAPRPIFPDTVTRSFPLAPSHARRRRSPLPRLRCFAGRIACLRLIVLAAAALALAPRAARAAAPLRTTTERTTFARSIAAVPAAATDANGRAHPAFINRTALRPDESAASMRFEVALTMRNFAELEARRAHS